MTLFFKGVATALVYHLETLTSKLASLRAFMVSMTEVAHRKIRMTGGSGCEFALARVYRIAVLDCSYVDISQCVCSMTSSEQLFFSVRANAAQNFVMLFTGSSTNFLVITPMLI